MRDRSRPTVAAAFSLMATQHGVATRRQLRACGISPAVERRLMSEGAIVPVARGVFAAGGAPRTFVASAMAASLRPGVRAVSHGTAARLHGLAGFEGYDRLDVIGRSGAHLTFEPLLITHYTRAALDDHIVIVGAVPATSIPLTLVHLAASNPPPTVGAALTSALTRGVLPTEIESVAAALRNAGRRGPAMILRLLSQLPARRA